MLFFGFRNLEHASLSQAIVRLRSSLVNATSSVPYSHVTPTAVRGSRATAGLAVDADDGAGGSLRQRIASRNPDGRRQQHIQRRKSSTRIRVAVSR